MSSRMQKIATCVSPIRSRSRKSGSTPVEWNTRARGSPSATILARSRDASIIRTPIPCSSNIRAIAVPARPAPKMTTSVTLPEPGAISSLQACAAAGEPITTMRSPTRMISSPPGRMIASSRMMPASFESFGSGAVRTGTPTTEVLAPSSTSNSTSCT